jgi:hypothetical protein
MVGNLLDRGGEGKFGEQVAAKSRYVNYGTRVIMQTFLKSKSNKLIDFAFSLSKQAITGLSARPGRKNIFARHHPLTQADPKNEQV